MRVDRSITVDVKVFSSETERGRFTLTGAQVHLFSRSVQAGLTLDVGCGRERLADINLDIDPETNPDVVADMDHLPFRDNAFYRCTFDHSFEHTSRPQQTLKEATRCSQQLHITVPNSQAMMRFFFAMILAPKSWWAWKYGGGLHQTFWTWRKARALDPRPRITGSSGYWKSRTLRNVAKVWARIAPPLADQIELDLSRPADRSKEARSHVFRSIDRPMGTRRLVWVRSIGIQKRKQK